jgi:hypothetical protein
LLLNASLVSEMQVIRVEAVLDVQKLLERMINMKKVDYIGSIAIFCNAILLTTGIRMGIQKALQILDEAIIFDKKS